MSIGSILGFAFGILGPISMGSACVFEYMARKLAKDPRCDKSRLEKLRTYADVGLVAAWLLLAAAYLSFQHLAADAAALASSFESWMTWMLFALLILDIVYLFLRRARPKKPGAKKRFWEI